MWRFHGDYPAWTYARESALRDRCVAVYEAQYGAKPQIVAIHAGLECGILSARSKGWTASPLLRTCCMSTPPNERAPTLHQWPCGEYLKAILAYKE